MATPSGNSSTSTSSSSTSNELILSRSSISDRRFDVTEIASLSDTDLSILALRGSDVPILLRQRAYALFATRKLVHDSLRTSPPPPDELTLRHKSLANFSESELKGSHPSAYLATLSPKELLLLQYHPSVTPSLHSKIQSRFFNSCYKARLKSPKAVKNLKVVEFKLEKARAGSGTSGGGSVLESERDGVTLEMGAASFRVLQDLEEEIVEVFPGDIEEILYIAGETHPELNNAQNCCLRIPVRCYMFEGKLFRTKRDEEDGGQDSPKPSFILTIDLGPLDTDDPQFIALRQIFRDWRAKGGFRIKAKEQTPPTTPAPRSRSPSPSHSHSRSRPHSPRASTSTSAVSRSNPKRKRDDSPPPRSRSYHGDLVLERRDDLDDEKDFKRRSSYPGEGGGGKGKERANGRESAPMEVDLAVRLNQGFQSDLWKYLSNIPVLLEWNPGFYSRQSALIRAINMQMDLNLPVFSAEEVVILSRRPDPTKLPVLLKSDERSRRYPPEERIGLERIYRDKAFVDIESTRWLMTTNAIPDLARYTRMMAKVVQCRDVFKNVWGDLLRSLESRRGDQTTRDPVESLIDLVQGLKDSEVRRNEVFSDKGLLITKCHLTREQLGVGPWRRFSESLSFIAEFEKSALDQYPPPGGSGIVPLGPRR